MRKAKTPDPPKGKNQPGERYEVPFEEQKAEQDRAEEIPSLDDDAYHGILGEIARKVEANSEADGRGVLGALLIGVGNILGRTACFRVNDTVHYCNEFGCIVGHTARARKGLATDIVRAVLGPVNTVWKEHCIAHGFSSGEGLVELVSDEVKRPKRKKDEHGQIYFEPEVVKEAVQDKRKLCLLSEFGELLTMMGREGNNLSMILRNAWDGLSPLEINTKQQPQRATGAHISILGNITKQELLKLLPRVPNSDGFCNRFLWFLVRRLQYMPEGGPRVEEYLIKEITQLQEAIRFARGLGEIRRSPEAKKLWARVYMELSAATDKGRLVVDRAEAHTLRLSGLYAAMDKSRQIEPKHLLAAHALWKFSEASALRLFGVEELCKEAQLVLDYLRGKGPEGATRTEIQNRVFYNHKTGAEIQAWLRALEERHVARYETEKNDNGNLVERWFAVQYSGSGLQNPASGSKKASETNEFATNSQKKRSRQASARANPQTNSPNSPNLHEKSEKTDLDKNHPNPPGEKPTNDSASENIFSANSANSANSYHEAAPVKDPPIRNPCEFVANSYVYAATPEEVSEALAPLREVKSLALDTETANDTLRLVQLSDGALPPVILDAQKVDLKTDLPPLLKSKELIVQNARFDLRILKDAFGLEIPTRQVFDTYVASALLTNTSVTQEERRRRKRRDWAPNRLESIARRTLGVELDKTHQDSDWSADFTAPENEPMLAYAANDVRHLHAIRLHLAGALEADGLLPVYELERDLIPCITEMSLTGLPVDVGALKTLYSGACAVAAMNERRLLESLKCTINPRSRKKQLLPALQALGLTVEGAPIASTDKKVLPLIDQADHPVVKAVLAWSIVNEEAKQLKTWLGLADQDKGWVWPEISQFGTMTHRFVYKKPNLQQVKKDIHRAMIIGPDGELIIRADFKTLELIIAAVRYGETTILEQLVRGVDLHRLTASTLFHVDLKDVSDKQRDIAKTTNFSLIYGRSLEEYIRALRRAAVDMTQEEMAQAYHDFDLAWPKWAAYRMSLGLMIAHRKHSRETRSLYGRRILLDESLSNRELRGALLNYRIQSTGSDMLKMTMLNFWNARPRGVSILASVHDEILLRAKPSKVKAAKALLREAAADAAKRILQSDVPVCLEIGVGKNWWEALQKRG
jgi:DNA polymerase I-like protein with 3'-5' exonuclease and polymerase domains